jgi:hypothetical protein
MTTIPQERVLDNARAVAGQRALGEVNAQIARMCGISVAAVHMLAAAGRKEADCACRRRARQQRQARRCPPDR